MITTKEYLSEIVKYINSYMENHGIKQVKLAEICQNNGINITQPTISRALAHPESAKLSTFVDICLGLDLDPQDVFNRRAEQDKKDTILALNSEQFIIDPSDKAFRGYKKKYRTFFYQTVKKDSEIIMGNLEFKNSPDNSYVEAIFSLPTGKKREGEDREDEIIKNYKGQLVVSEPMRAAYCILCSENEICAFTFSHFHINNEQLKCVMANVVTVSAGSNRRPTIHRMCIIDEKIEIDKDSLEYIKGQLLLNEANILISASNLEALRKSEKLSPDFKQQLEAARSKESYYSFSESKLIDGDIDEETARSISIVRNHSISGKYNKISMRTDDMLYAIIKSIQKK